MGQCASSSGGNERKTPRQHRREAAKEAASRPHDAKPAAKAEHAKPSHVVGLVINHQNSGNQCCTTTDYY